MSSAVFRLPAAGRMILGLGTGVHDYPDDGERSICPLHEGHSIASPRIYVLHSGQHFISIPPLPANSAYPLFTRFAGSDNRREAAIINRFLCQYYFNRCLTLVQAINDPCRQPWSIAPIVVITLFAGWSQNGKGAGKISPLCPRKDACFPERLTRHWRISAMPPW
jgi:hypothetical protein